MKTNDIPQAHPSLLDALHRQDAKAHEMRPSEGFTEKVMKKVMKEEDPPLTGRVRGGSALHRIAAIFLAASFLGGLAWAFVPLLRTNQTTKPPQPTKISTPLPTREGQGGGSSSSISFSNLRLDSILTAVAAHYECKVCFRDSATQAMKFITTWNPEDSLAAFIEHLNMFDGLHLTLRDDTIFVESTNDEEGAQ